MTASPELSRPIGVERLAGQTIEHAIEATAAECAAIAQRLLIPEVRSLKCRFTLAPASGGRPGEILATGHLSATVVRECVVTLDAFAMRVTEDFRIRFVVEGTQSEDDDPEADDEVAYGGVTIDLGEAAVEQLALALDPYPRKPGAALPPEAVDAEEGPFAALARRPRAD